MFDRVVGQNRVKEMLHFSIQSGRLGHAYLFHGLHGIGKKAFAIEFAKGLNCLESSPLPCQSCSSCLQMNHLDYPAFRMVLPVPTKPKAMKENKYLEVLRERALTIVENPYARIQYTPEISTLPGIGIDAIRALKHEVTLKTQGNVKRIFLIDQADLMTIPASNSLLKLLEEPPGNTLLILITDNPGKLLPTIISRCQSVRFDLLNELEISDALINRYKVDEKRAQFMARMSGGSLQRALELSGDMFEEKRQQTLQFFAGSLSKNGMKRLASAEVLLQNEKSDILEYLKILVFILRDLLLISLEQDDTILNLDHKEKFQSFLQKYPSFRIEDAIRHVEQSVDFIHKNVYLDAVIFSLNQSLFECLAQD